jgi:hypothetical protein
MVNNAFMGMNALLGVRNVLIIGNPFSENDPWGININVGSHSYAVKNTLGASGIPEGRHFATHIFHSGTESVSNGELTPSRGVGRMDHVSPKASDAGIQREGCIDLA